MWPIRDDDPYRIRYLHLDLWQLLCRYSLPVLRAACHHGDPCISGIGLTQLPIRVALILIPAQHPEKRPMCSL